MRIDSKTVDEYVEKVPEKWKGLIVKLRKEIISTIDKGFVEAIRWGMINYEVPLEVSGPTYNKQPLGFVSLAAQKNYCSLYVNAIYASPSKRKQLDQAFLTQGLTPNMGKSCIRFKKIEDIPLNEILSILSEFTVEDFLLLVKNIRNDK